MRAGAETEREPADARTRGATSARGRSRGAEAILPLAAAAIAVAVWSVGLGRAWEWDEADMVGHVVRTTSFKAPFVVGGYGNHVLMSVLENGLFRITGSSSEVVARLVPVAFGAATVALLVLLTRRRFGTLPALVAAALFVTNPLVFDVTRQIRGYAAVTFFAFASSVVLVRLLREHPMRRPHLILYALLLAAGTAAHLYMLAVFVVHGAFALGRSVRLTKGLLGAWAAGAALGILANAAALVLGTAQVTGRSFLPAFPVELGWSLAGSQPVAVVVTVALLAFAAPTLLRRRDVRAALAAVALLVGVEWLVLQPVFLFPRFFIWLTPVVAVGVAYGVDRARARVPAAALVALVAVAVAGQVLVWAPHATDDHFANRAAATTVAPAADAGARVCTQALSRQLMRGYRQYPVAATDDELDKCDLVIVLTESMQDTAPEWSSVARGDDQIERVHRHFGSRVDLAAQVPGAIYHHGPSSCVTAFTEACRSPAP